MQKHGRRAHRLCGTEPSREVAHLSRRRLGRRNRQGGGGQPVRAAFRIMVVHLLLAALQGAPIARRMQEMSEAECVIAAQNAYSPDCTPESTAMNCMNEQLAPKCQKMGTGIRES